MTPYNHLRSQHCNACWRGQFIYIAQLQPFTEIIETNAKNDLVPLAYGQVKDNIIIYI